MKTDWQLNSVDSSIIDELHATFPLNRELLRLLYSRGYNDPRKLDSFLNSRMSDLHSPFLINGMRQAVARAKKAISTNEKIGIFADSDLDGITSLTVLYTLFNKMDIQPYMRCLRDDETYGLKNEIIDEFKTNGITLLITVDSGVRDIDVIAYARQQGIDVIVTDHHEQDTTLPDAIIINPKLHESGYPFKELAGVGVAYKFCQAILMSYLPGYNKTFIIIHKDEQAYQCACIRDGVIEKYAEKNSAEEIYEAFDSDSHILLLFETGLKIEAFNNGTVYNYGDFFVDKSLQKKTLSLDELCDHYSFNQDLYDNTIELLAKLFLEMQYASSPKIRDFINIISGFVSIGSIADIVPLVDENRILVKRGIDSLQGTTHPGLAFLNHDVITSKNIAWNIAPLLNTPGRYGRTQLTVDFFLSDDYTLIQETIEKIKKLNEERKQSVHELVAKYKSEIDTGAIGPVGNMFFIKSAEIPEGIAGLIANRLAETYKKPVIIGSINQETNIVKGSGRAHGNALFFSYFKDHTEKFVDIGGHEQAFGFTIDVGDIDTVLHEIGETVSNHNENEMKIDLVLELENISAEFINELHILEPFGKGNEEPLFLSKNITLETFSAFGNDNLHGKSTFLENSELTAIWWNRADTLKKYFESDKPVDVLYTLTNHEFRNTIYPRMMLVDVVEHKN